MARYKIPDDKKKQHIGVTIDKVIDSLMNEHLKDIGLNRSKYIENLIRIDMEKRGFDVEPEF